jgi:hypothetical protein
MLAIHFLVTVSLQVFELSVLPTVKKWYADFVTSAALRKV